MDILNEISLFLQTSVQMGTHILFAIVGGIICEKVGNMNLGIEGMMLMGAAVGFQVACATANPFLAVLSAGLAGLVGALIYAFITVTLRGSEQALSQLILQTERLEVTRQVFELDPEKSLQRELLLLKVACDNHSRAELREISSIYKAKIIDLSPDSMVFELIGKPEKIDAFLKMFADYTILELCRTGVTALERGGMHQHMQKPPQEVRDAQLPLPGTKCH